MYNYVCRHLLIVLIAHFLKGSDFLWSMSLPFGGRGPVREDGLCDISPTPRRRHVSPKRRQEKAVHI